jgi:MFS family permease
MSSTVVDESSGLLDGVKNQSSQVEGSIQDPISKFEMSDGAVRPLLALVYLSAFSESFISSVGTAFFPQKAHSRFGISDSYVGIVFAILPAVVSISSPIVAYLCNYLGRMPVVCIGTLVEIVGIASFGLSRSVVGFCISRAVTGFGSACVQVACMALLVSNIKNLEDAVGIQEILVGLGFLLGAPLGAALFSVIGFEWVFFSNAIFVGTVLIYALVNWRLYPTQWKLFEAEKSEIEVSDSLKADEDKEAQSELTAEERETLPQIPGMLLMDRVIVSTAISCGVLFFIVAASEPILAPHIQALLNLKTSLVGLVFSIISVSYTLLAGFAGEISRITSPKTTLSLGLLLMGLGMLFCGPLPILDQIDSLAASWSFIISSFVIMGGGLAIGLVPGVPLMKEGADKAVYANRNKYKADEKFLSNFVSGVFSSAISLGQVLGPLVIGFIMEYVPQRKQVTCMGSKESCSSGIQWTCTILGGIALVTLLIFQVAVPNYQVRKVSIQEVKSS